MIYTVITYFAAYFLDVKVCGKQHFFCFFYSFFIQIPKWRISKNV